jgi:hypothetical protein
MFAIEAVRKGDDVAIIDDFEIEFADGGAGSCQ